MDSRKESQSRRAQRKVEIRKAKRRLRKKGEIDLDGKESFRLGVMCGIVIMTIVIALTLSVMWR